MDAIGFLGALWSELIIRPMLNTLLVLYVISFSNSGVAIIVFTVLVRLITLPLALKQIRQMMGMTALQPKLRELQARHGKDRARISQETMRMYREAGISPLGCLGPMVVQMPILFGLYRVLIQTLFTKPDDLVGLSEKLYPWIPFFQIHAAAPLGDNFLGIHLGVNPGPSLFIIPLLVAASTWVQQKMTTMPSPDPRQQSSQKMMLYMMPVMLGFFAFSFPTGLSLYWIVSNIIGIAIQYFVAGWGTLFPLFPKAAPVPAEARAQPPPDGAPKEIGDNGSTSNDRPHRGRGHRTGAERARRRARRGRGRNIK